MERLAALMDQHSGWLMRDLVRRGLGWQDAEDVLSVVWERAWRHLDELRDPVGPWLHRTARNAAVDWWRRERWQTAGRLGASVSLDTPMVLDGELVEAPLVSDAGDVEAEALASVMVGAALEALGQVDPARRACLALWLAGLNYQEIGQRLGLTRPTVRSRLHRGRLELRRLGLGVAA